MKFHVGCNLAVMWSFSYSGSLPWLRMMTLDQSIEPKYNEISSTLDSLPGVLAETELIFLYLTRQIQLIVSTLPAICDSDIKYKKSSVEAVSLNGYEIPISAAYTSNSNLSRSLQFNRMS